MLAEVALAAGEARAWRALEQLDLTAFAKRHPRDLSSGERERLAIAAVLAVEPDLLVLDEPTRGVDPERKRELAALLRAQAPYARDARRDPRPRLRDVRRGHGRSRSEARLSLSRQGQA